MGKTTATRSKGAARSARGKLERDDLSAGAQISRGAASRTSQVAQARDLAKMARTPSSSKRGLRAKAKSGIKGADQPIPHLEMLQGAFGSHDLSTIVAAVGGAASLACSDLNAHAYANNGKVAFAQKPSLWLAAHEAAHVVQERGGDKAKKAEKEQVANEVADRVVADQDVEGLLPSEAGQDQSERAVHFAKKDDEEAQQAQTTEAEGPAEDEEAEEAEAEEGELSEEEQAELAEAQQKAKDFLSHFDSRFADSRDRVGLLGAYIGPLADLMTLGPDFAAEALLRISLLCDAARAQWSQEQGDAKDSAQGDMEEAVKGVDFKGIAEAGVDKLFKTLLIKTLTQFLKSLSGHGSGRASATAWGRQMVRDHV